MSEVIVVAEQREGKFRDVTFELISKAKELSKSSGFKITGVILGYGTNELAQELSLYGLDEVVSIEHEILKNYSCEGYVKALSSFLREREPVLTMIGHTVYGLDYAPALAAELNFPLVTDCINLSMENRKLKVTRQMYSGKINVEFSFPRAEKYMVTVRPTVFKPAEKTGKKSRVVKVKAEIPVKELKTKFIELIKPSAEEVDISQADVIVSVGRGIGDKDNLPIVESLAEAIGAALGASRPVVDNGWLPKSRQVGQSGKTVKPKVYLAVGISGAMQHVMGMKGSETVIAINKDPNAPIFDVSDYGVVANLFDIVPTLTETIKKIRGT